MRILIISLTCMTATCHATRIQKINASDIIALAYSKIKQLDQEPTQLEQAFIMKNTGTQDALVASLTALIITHIKARAKAQGLRRFPIALIYQSLPVIRKAIIATWGDSGASDILPEHQNLL